jgi:hypothetical protein
MPSLRIAEAIAKVEPARPGGAVAVALRVGEVDPRGTPATGSLGGQVRPKWVRGARTRTLSAVRGAG